jgi:hypothetical protein
LMLSRIPLITMPDLTDIKTIPKKGIQGTAGESNASQAGSCSGYPNLTSDFLSIQLHCANDLLTSFLTRAESGSESLRRRWACCY